MNTSHCTEELFEDDSCEESTGCFDDFVELEETTTVRNYKYNNNYKPVHTTMKYRYDFTEPATTTTEPNLPKPEHRRKRPHQGKRRRKPNTEAAKCAVADWTEWSPCSVTCGNGYKIRTRVYRVPFIPNRVCDVRLTQKIDCRETTCWSSDYYDEDTPGALQVVETEYDDNENMEPREPYCKEDPNPGFCYGSMDQWYYNATNGECAMFKYTGCAGNKNNFATESECLEVCHPLAGGKGFSGFQSHLKDDYDDDEDILLGDDPSVSDRVDCQVSSWSYWSQCSSQCGRGWMTRERMILRPSTNGGKECPRKMMKRKRCVGTDC